MHHDKPSSDFSETSDAGTKFDISERENEET